MTLHSKDYTTTNVHMDLFSSLKTCQHGSRLTAAKLKKVKVTKMLVHRESTL